MSELLLPPKKRKYLQNDSVLPAGFWLLNADVIGLVETFVPLKSLWALARLDQRCGSVVQPRLQALAALRLAPFYMTRRMILHTSLHLQCRNLRAEGAQTLAAIIAGGHMAHLLGLFLEGAWTSDSGAQTLAPALRHLPRLVHLDLEGNGIGEAGVAALARATADGALSRLRVLDLQNNRIGDGGVRALAAAVAGGAFATLQVLHLGGNKIGDAGAEALATACARPDALPRLVDLQLDHNKIGDAGMRALAVAIAGGGLAALRVVDVGENLGRVEPIREAMRRQGDVCSLVH